LGFFEVFIWLVAIGQIMQHLTNIVCYVAYAGGFAFGNVVGMRIEDRVALGKVVVRVMTHHDPGEFMTHLREGGYGVTHLLAEGGKGPVHVVFTIIDRATLSAIIPAVEKYHPNSFYTIEDIRSAKEGIFPGNNGIFQRLFPARLERRGGRRKAK